MLQALLRVKQLGTWDVGVISMGVGVIFLAEIPITNHPDTQRIHGTGIFTYISHKNHPNVGKYSSPIDIPYNIPYKSWHFSPCHLVIWWSGGVSGSGRIGREVHVLVAGQDKKRKTSVGNGKQWDNFVVFLGWDWLRKKVSQKFSKYDLLSDWWNRMSYLKYV